jgi:hypothetical protein
MHYRQGDLLIVKTNILPEKRNIVPSGILLHGETTGHSHRVESPGRVSVDSRGGIFIESEETVNVVHEEHDTIEIPEGRYYIVRQREYDEKEIRYVTD